MATQQKKKKTAADYKSNLAIHSLLAAFTLANCVYLSRTMVPQVNENVRSYANNSDALRWEVIKSIEAQMKEKSQLYTGVYDTAENILANKNEPFQSVHVKEQNVEIYARRALREGTEAYQSNLLRLKLFRAFGLGVTGVGFLGGLSWISYMCSDIAGIYRLRREEKQAPKPTCAA